MMLGSRLFKLVVVLAVASIMISGMVGCSSSSSSGTTEVIVSTNGGSLTTGTGTITVRVVDACSGDAIDDAWVWIDSDIANAVQTNVNGSASLTNVAGSVNDRMITAGKDGWSLASVLTDATSVNLGLIVTDVSGVGQTTTISGTVNFAGSQGNATVSVLDQDEDVGFTADVAVNTAGSGTFSISVPTGRAMLLMAHTRDGDGTLTAVDVASISALSSALTGVVLDVPAAATPVTLSNGSISNIPTGHDNGGVFASGELRWGFLDFEFAGLSIAANAATVSNFQLPASTVGSNTTLLLAGTIGVFTSDSSTGQFSETFSPVGSSTTFPTISMNSGALSVSITTNGVTPTVSFTSSLVSTTGFHEIFFGNGVSVNRQRNWTFYVSGGTGSFTVPAVHASVADEGLVSGQSYNVEVDAHVTSVADFDDYDISNTLESTSGVLFGDGTIYAVP